jgi:hypothetical protein
MYFFTDIDLLEEQTADKAFGPVTGNETTQYRVTSLHNAVNDPKAYAVCNGLVFAQTIEDGKCNIILKPTQQQRLLAYTVKYFIYKGIDINSLIDINVPDFLKLPEAVSDNTRVVPLLNVIKESQDYRNSAYDKLHDNPVGTTTQRAKINALGFNLMSNAFGADNLPDDSFIDEVFQKNGIDQFPLITGGSILGIFKKELFGFEIILEGVGEGPTMKTARNTETIVLYNPNVTVNKDKFKERDKREKILNYIDPCCFYSSFYVVSEKPLNKSKYKKTNIRVFASNSETANILDNESLYNLVLSKYNTVNRIYLDIRNEHNHSLNYYNNYNDTGNEYAEIKIAFDSTNIQINNYENGYGWPIFIIDTGMFTQTVAIYSVVSLKLPIKDNSLPSIFLAQGYFQATYPATNNRLVDVFPDQADTEYTILRKLAVPKLNDTTTIPYYLNVRYLKRITGLSILPNNYILKAEHYLDNLFELTQLVNQNGPIIPFNNNDITQWAYTGISVYVDRTANYGDHYIAKVGIAKDIDSVSFYALADDENFIAGTSKQNNFFSIIEDDLEYYKELNTTIKTINNGITAFLTGIPNLLPDNIFELPFKPNRLYMDGRSLVHINISHTEFDTVQQKMTLLEAEYDKRLVLKKNGTEFSFESRTYQQYEIAIRGYKTTENNISPHDEDTGIYVVKWREDKSRIFYSQGYLQNLPQTSFISENRRNFKSSFLSQDAQLNIRSSPDIPNNSDNRLIQIVGITRLSVLGKKEDNNQNVWYYVEWENDLNGLVPGSNTEPKTIPPGQGWLRPNLSENNIYDRVFYPVASLKKFICDLFRLNKQLDDEQDANNFPIDDICQRITRLRQRTKESGKISELFDDVIDSTSSNPYPERLNDIPYDGGENETINSFQLDTNMQLFRDYMGVELDGGIIIDLHHLFIGLDVLNHYVQNKTASLGILNWFVGAPSHYGNNIDTSTWAGDLGAISPDLLQDRDEKFREYWENNNPDASDENKLKAFLNHFYNTRASDIDMITNAIVHRIHKYQNRYLFNNHNFKNIESLLYFDFLMIFQDGLKPSFDVFFNYLGLDATKIFDPDNTNFEQQEREEYMLNAIQFFSRWWRAKNIASVGDFLFYPPNEELRFYNEIIIKRYLKWLDKYR